MSLNKSYKDNTFYVGLEDVITLTDWLNAVVGASYNQRKNILAQEYGTHYLTGQSNVFMIPSGSDSAFDSKADLFLNLLKIIKSVYQPQNALALPLKKNVTQVDLVVRSLILI